MNIFTNEMFSFANCEQSQFQNGRCTQWILFIQIAFIPFKTPKVRLDKYFYHWNVHFCYFRTKSQLRVIAVWKDGRGTFWIFMIFFGFIASIKGKVNVGVALSLWILMICLGFITSIKGRLFRSSKSLVGQLLLPLKCLFLLFLYKK